MRHLTRWMVLIGMLVMTAGAHANGVSSEGSEDMSEVGDAPIYDERVAGWDEGEPEPLPWSPPVPTEPGG